MGKLVGRNTRNLKTSGRFHVETEQSGRTERFVEDMVIGLGIESVRHGGLHDVGYTLLNWLEFLQLWLVCGERKALIKC